MGKTLRHPVAGLLAASVTVVARKREGAPLILSLPLRLAVVGSLAAVHKVVPMTHRSFWPPLELLPGQFEIAATSCCHSVLLWLPRG
nr:uncharacterized protein LOC112737782 isoform X2 [Arachis hypogaea]